MTDAVPMTKDAIAFRRREAELLHEFGWIEIGFGSMLLQPDYECKGESDE
jgi:hypothetical protein